MHEIFLGYANKSPVLMPIISPPPGMREESRGGDISEAGVGSGMEEQRGERGKDAGIGGEEGTRKRRAGRGEERSNGERKRGKDAGIGGEGTRVTTGRERGRYGHSERKRRG